MSLTQTEALSIVSLETMKTELRIPLSETSHDALLSEQITNAANYVAASTGLELADLPPLRSAIVAATRDQYDGYREIGPRAAVHAWADPFRSLAD